MNLTYYIERMFNEFEEFYEYKRDSISEDEIYARQLCEYFIKSGKQYQLKSTEMNEESEILVLEEMGEVTTFSDEKNYSGLGLNIEFRLYNDFGDMPLLSVKHIKSHWEAIRYLLKDVVDVPNRGQMLRDSSELDEDRQVYVIYVTELPS
ncbi:RNA helicase [Bacillus thuringiensis]|uniref:RNA helicase n=1 Tax=Bacillus thuringiensis TaxID=1428 RepID=UPI0021D6813D|nr:RNA helicase [Bacillus thuringiensis]MCU7667206.1 RNA helicase [Bacillus thuringiensis]